MAVPSPLTQHEDVCPLGVGKCPINADVAQNRDLQTTTTHEENLHSASQRKVNLIWEYSQSSIALIVVMANVLAVFFLPKDSPLLANAFFLIVGFYFGRTNHSRVGGVNLTQSLTR